MKLAILILTAAGAVGQAEGPEVRMQLPQEIAEACADEGGCTLMSSMAIDRMSRMAFEAGRASANGECRKGAFL